MTRWHESSCQAPEIIIEAGTGWPRCRTCRNSAPLENLLDRQPPSDPLLSPPLDEFPGELNLHWLPCVPYFSSPKPAFRPRLQLWAKASQQASKPNYNDSSSTLAPPEISTIYERRLTSNEFRLLRLCPVQNGDDPFHLSLHTYTHDDCPEYETVSYTWGGEEGDSSLCKPIFLGPYWDVLFQTRNCWDMLKLLRPREGFRMVWVDAICINQRDKEEREDQVAKMGRIYEDALRVVVHLGQNLVSPLPPSAVYPSRHKFHQFNDRLPKGPTLKEVLQRKYFSRVWVVQELIISRQALIRIGNVEFVIDQQTSKNIESSLQGLNWANIVAQWAQHIAQGCIPRKSTSLLDMIFLTWNSQASDPRDKVFGILGLLENLTPIVRPDYSISSQHVLIGIAAHCLINLRDIRILSMAPGIRNCGSLPSWVPNPISSELLARRPRLERNTTEQFTLKWQKEAIQKLRDQELSDSALNIVGDTSRLEGRYRHVFWPLVVDKTICGWNSKAVVETSTGAVVLNPVHLLQITSRPKLVYSAEDLRVFEIFGRSGTNSFYLVTCDVALDTCVNPKEDHLFLLAKEDSTSLYLVLRRLRKGYSRRFHLVCSCEQLFFR
ncbi:HET-domain-containing protein, partial [Hyaloscypha variabilis F]